MSRRCLALRAVAKKALEFRQATGIKFEEPCDVYETIARHGVDLQFVDIPSLEGMYLEEAEAERICVCSHRPVGRQHFTAAHELGHHVLGHGTSFDAVIDEFGAANDSTPDEVAADAFARYLLMPPRAVQGAFRQRGFDLDHLEPLDVYRAACWLGVGYSTLLNQMLYSLGLLTPPDYKRLSKISPKNIRAKLAGAVSDRDVWAVDYPWADRRLHTQLGDIVVGLAPGRSNHLLKELQGGKYIANAVGESVFPLAAGGSLTVSVSRAAYVGFYEYRYLRE
jgi:Zn-dependent peptidase ImmA (M78 family)